MLIGSIRDLPPHVHVWKAGAVVKIDLATHAAVEVVTGDPLNASLEQVQVVEDVRRTLREIRH